jgi:hypothetical protein
MCESLETRRLLATFTCADTDDTVTISTTGNSINVFWNGHGNQVFTNPGQLVIHALGGNDTINIWGSGAYPVDIIVNMGEGDDSVRFSPTAGQLDNIDGFCTLNGGGGADSVVASDFNSNGPTTYTVTNAHFSRPGWGGFFYQYDIEALTLQQGRYSDVVNVTGTFTNQPVWLINFGGTDTVNVGNSAQGVQGVTGALHAYGSDGRIVLNINDTGDTTFRSCNFDWNGVSSYGRVNNLAPAIIDWETATTDAVNVTTGSAGDIVQVYSITVPLTLNSAGGDDAVNIGHDIVGGSYYIWAPVTIENNPAYTNLTINNYLDTSNKSWTIDSAGSYGSITGFATAPIYWDNADINQIFLDCGRGRDIGLVKRLSESLVVTNADGDNIDQITFGHPSAGGLQSITPGRGTAIVIENDPDYTDVILDDTGNSSARIATLDIVSGYNEITGLAPATFRIDDNDVKALTLTTGSDADVVNVLRAGTNGGKLTIASSGGFDAVTLGNSNTGMQEIIGAVDVTNTPAFTTLTMNNRADTGVRNVAQAYDVGTFIGVTGLFPGTLRYAATDVVTVSLMGGGGIDSYVIRATGGSLPLRLETGAGADSLTVGGGTTFAQVDLVENLILDQSITVQNMSLLKLNGSSAQQMCVTNALSVAGGRFDLVDKTLLFNYSGASPVDSIRNSIRNAYNAGQWNADGITSSAAMFDPGAAIGYGEATSYYTSFPSMFQGYSVDNTTILMRYTRAGDANNDHTVNVGDLGILASNWQQSGRTFALGDFDYNGVVNINDLGILASNWQASTPAPTSPFAGTSGRTVTRLFNELTAE